MKPPGLIKQEIIGADGDLIWLHEVWDLTVPGCPIVAINKDICSLDRKRWLHRSLVDPALLRTHSPPHTTTEP